MTGQAHSGREHDPGLPARSLVWSAGRLTPAESASPTRRLLARAGLGLGAAAAVVALVAGVHAWPVSPPVGTTPSTPLWAAPQVAATNGPTDLRPAAPETRVLGPAEPRVEPSSTVEPPNRAPGAGLAVKLDGDRGPSTTVSSRAVRSSRPVAAPRGAGPAKASRDEEGGNRGRGRGRSGSTSTEPSGTEEGNRGRGRGRSGSTSTEPSGAEDGNRGRGRGRSGSASTGQSGAAKAVDSSGSGSGEQDTTSGLATDRDSSGRGSGRDRSEGGRSGRDAGADPDPEVREESSHRNSSDNDDHGDAEDGDDDEDGDEDDSGGKGSDED